MRNLRVLGKLQWGFDLVKEFREGSWRKSLLGESWWLGQGQKGREASWLRALLTMVRAEEVA